MHREAGASPIRLLRELFDAHDMVIAAAESAPKGHARDHGAYDRDFAVGQVVIVNDLQSRSIAEELMRRDNSRRFWKRSTCEGLRNSGPGQAEKV